jgi:hypothetical protein
MNNSTIIKQVSSSYQNFFQQPMQPFNGGVVYIACLVLRVKQKSPSSGWGAFHFYSENIAKSVSIA